MHQAEWERVTLESAIRQLWEISGVPQRFEASLQIDPLPWEPQLEVKILIYRGLQEALSNLVRHSEATRSAVALEVRDGQLVLSIRDNGVGFDAAGGDFSPPVVDHRGGLRFTFAAAPTLGGGSV